LTVWVSKAQTFLFLDVAYFINFGQYLRFVMYYYTKTEINMPLAQTSICVFRRPMVVPGLIHYTCIWCSIYIYSLM